MENKVPEDPIKHGRFAAKQGDGMVISLPCRNLKVWIIDSIV